MPLKDFEFWYHNVSNHLFIIRNILFLWRSQSILLFHLLHPWPTPQRMCLLPNTHIVFPLWPTCYSSIEKENTFRKPSISMLDTSLEFKRLQSCSPSQSWDRWRGLQVSMPGSYGSSIVSSCPPVVSKEIVVVCSYEFQLLVNEVLLEDGTIGQRRIHKEWWNEEWYSSWPMSWESVANQGPPSYFSISFMVVWSWNNSSSSSFCS